MKLLQQLIQIPSTSTNEDKILLFLDKYIKKLNLNPIFIGQNIVVKMEGKNSNTALIFNAHVDTVTPGNLNSWDHLPFEGKIKNGKIYGLGSSDDKAGIATLLLLLENLQINKPSCDVWIAFVSQEEITGEGTNQFIKWFLNENKKYKNIAGVIAEPTDCKTIENMHKGSLFVKIITFGEGVHGHNPHKIKTHAVLKMFEIVKKLEGLSKAWEEKYLNPYLGSPTIAPLTYIKAGEKETPNKIPDYCEGVFDIRTTPKMHKIAYNQIKNLLKKENVKIEKLYTFTPPGLTNAEEPVIQIFKKISGGEILPAQYSTDLWVFTKANIPAFIFGPGNKETIHTPKEFCEIKNIFKCKELFAKLIKEFGEYYEK